MTLLALFDLAVAARPSMGQEPIRAHPDAAGKVDTVRITRAYGRFGNNVYQLLNAATVARHGGFRRLVVPPLALSSSFDGFALDGLAIEPDVGAPMDGCLAGSFFVPYGCEAAALRCGSSELASLVRRLADGLFGHVLDTPAEPGTIALHFRSGDVFRPGAVPAAYVQPPATFYLKALEHARAEGGGGLVDLVYEDRANPAIAVVEDELRRRDVAFRSDASGTAEDLRRLLNASTVVASASTFVEAAALLSRRLRRYYSFREHGSQAEFKPFAQARIGDLLRDRDVRCVLIDDVSRTYVNKWQWTATAEQRRAVAEFDAAQLRIYESA